MWFWIRRLFFQAFQKLQQDSKSDLKTALWSSWTPPLKQFCLLLQVRSGCRIYPLLQRCVFKHLVFISFAKMKILMKNYNRWNFIKIQKFWKKIRARFFKNFSRDLVDRGFWAWERFPNEKNINDLGIIATFEQYLENQAYWSITEQRA